MAVFRVERNTGYTVMSNHHLRNKELTLKAKGLLSQMLSLPERYDYLLKNSDGLKKQIQKLESDTEIPAYVICNVEHNCMIVETEISATQKMIASLQETE